MGRLAIQYLCPSIDINHDAFMMGAIRKETTRDLGRMQPDTSEDIRDSVGEALGLNTESWNEVCTKKAMDKVFFRSASRVLVGSSLYRNEEYLYYSMHFASWMGAAAILVGQYTPWILKPIFGYLLALPIYYCQQKALKFLRPVVRDRIANIARKRADPSFDFEEPKDLITWVTQAMLDGDKMKNNPPDFIGIRLLVLVSQTSILYRPSLGQVQRVHRFPTYADHLIQSLGAIHTSLLTGTNLFLDLVSSDPNAGFWEQLRKEAAGAFQTADDWTNLASLSRLPLADSAVRESLRRNPIILKILLREVVPEDGVVLPSGHHLPKGSWLATDTVDLHYDDRFYLKPEGYDPFQFAKGPEDALASTNKDNLTAKASIYRKNQSLSTTSDTYLALGFGRHAW